MANHKTKVILLSTVILFLPALVSGGRDWPMFRHDPAHTGYTSLDANYSVSDYGLLWRYKTGDMIRASPAVADLNDDGLLEVVVGSYDGSLYALGHEGNVLWVYSTNSSIHSSPTIGRLTNKTRIIYEINGTNTTIEPPKVIAFGANDGRMYLLNSTGHLMWSYQTEDRITSSPVIANVDSSWESEIIFGSMDEHVYCVDYEGKLLWKFKTNDPVESSPALADLDDDGVDDIIVGSDDTVLYGMTSPPYRTWRYQVNGFIKSSPLVSKFVGGGDWDMIFGCEDGRLYRISFVREKTETRDCVGEACVREVYTSKIELVWNYSTGRRIVSSPALGAFPIGNETKYYIAVGSNDGLLHLVNLSGDRVRWYTTSKAVESSPAIADLDGDGLPEIIFGSNDRTVYMINYTGYAIFAYATNGSVKSSPAVADLDGDGTFEVAVGSDDGYLYVFGSPSAKERQKGNLLYKTAEEYYAQSDVNRSLDYIRLAREIYLDINYSEGIRLCDNFAKRMQADRIYSKAELLFREGELKSAFEHAMNATNLYTELNYTLGMSKGRMFLTRLDAETYYAEAEYLYASDMLFDSLTYSRQSKDLYSSINYGLGMEKADRLINHTLTRIAGDGLYAVALNLSNTTDYAGIKSNLIEANESYALINYTKGLSQVASLWDRVVAEELFKKLELAEGVEWSEDICNSLENAKKLYEQLNNIEFSKKIGRMHESCTAYVEAEDLLKRAQRYYTATDFRSALEYAEKAVGLYNRAGDVNGSRSAEEIVGKAKDRLYSTGRGGGGLMDLLVSNQYLAVIGFFGVIIVLLSLWPAGPRFIVLGASTRRISRRRGVMPFAGRRFGLGVYNILIKGRGPRRHPSSTLSGLAVAPGKKGFGKQVERRIGYRWPERRAVVVLGDAGKLEEELERQGLWGPREIKPRKPSLRMRLLGRREKKPAAEEPTKLGDKKGEEPLKPEEKLKTEGKPEKKPKKPSLFWRFIGGLRKIPKKSVKPAAESPKPVEEKETLKLKDEKTPKAGGELEAEEMPPEKEGKIKLVGEFGGRVKKKRGKKKDELKA